MQTPSLVSPNLRDAIWRTQTLPGWCPFEKAEYLANLVLSNRPDTVVELGIFGGRSLIPMAMAAKEIGHGIVWGIDPWTRSAAIDGEHNPADLEWWSKINLESIYCEFADAVLKWKVTNECRWLRMTSKEASVLFEKGSIDILHQDSNHSEKISCNEIELWYDRVRDGGFWVLDDCDWASNKKAFGICKETMTTIKETPKWAVFRK